MNPIELLQNIQFFDGLSDSDIVLISQKFQIVQFKKGKTVIDEGDIGDCFYIIGEGEIEINRRIDLSQTVTPLIKLGVNEYFGEMSLIDENPRSANAVAFTDVTLLKLSKDDFIGICLRHPSVLFNLIRTLSGRLRDTNQKFIDMVDTLIRKNKLVAIGMAASKIIHDMKTPLSVIVLTAQMLERLYPESEEYTRDIIQQTQTMDQMVKEILDFAKGQPSQLDIEEVPFNDFVDEVVMTAKQMSNRKQIEFLVDNSVIVSVVFDRKKISRCLYNLIKNSIESIEIKGTIRLSIEKIEDKLHFSLLDNGPGIPENVIEKMFEPFISQGKENGTGLGLAICHKIVQDHNGIITCHRAPAGGTKVDIFIPATWKNYKGL